MGPKITVIVMIYNSSRHLAGCLESLLQQTFSDFEVLLVDDGSSDGSDTICRRYAAADARFRVLRFAENKGLSRCRAETLPEAQGEYVAILDSDDLAQPGRLEQEAALLDGDEEAVLAAGYYGTIDEAGEILPAVFRAPLTDAEIRWRIAFGNCLGHSTVMFRKAAALECGGYSAAMLAGEDMEFYSRLLTKGRTVVVPEIIGYWRTHSENKHKTEPSEYRDFYGLIVQQSIQRHLCRSVSEDVAAALVDSYLAPAATPEVFREAVQLTAISPWLLRNHHGQGVPVALALKRSALLGLMKLRRCNVSEPWWSGMELHWQRAVRDLSFRGKKYFWFADSALYKPKRMIAKKELIPLAKALFAPGGDNGGIRL